MKIGVIADTHIPVQAQSIPKKVLLGLEGMDMIIHAGDLVSIDVLKELLDICPDVRAVYGNMDPGELRDNLKEKEIIKINNFKIGVAHGQGIPSQLIELTTNIFRDDDVDMIIFGHSHSGLNLKKGKILYFNPGSPTDKIFAPYNSYGIVTIDDIIEGRIVKING